jgi:hypothetical protein
LPDWKPVSIGNRTPNTAPCRLCPGAAAEVFRKTILLRHDVGYRRCADCGSLFTDQPHWLDET